MLINATQGNSRNNYLMAECNTVLVFIQTPRIQDSCWISRKHKARRKKRNGMNLLFHNNVSNRSWTSSNKIVVVTIMWLEAKRLFSTLVIWPVIKKYQIPNAEIPNTKQRNANTIMWLEAKRLFSTLVIWPVMEAITCGWSFLQLL